MTDLSKKLIDALFDELKNKGKKLIPDKHHEDFEKYIKDYFENPSLVLAYKEKDSEKYCYYIDIINEFIKVTKY